MERDKAYEAWVGTLLRGNSTTRYDTFKAGWEAAIEEFVVKATPEEPWGTLVGASDYLEHADRMSFLDLRRAKTAGYHETSIDFLQGRWIAIGEAWGIVQGLIKSEEQAKQPQEQATGI